MLEAVHSDEYFVSAKEDSIFITKFTLSNILNKQNIKNKVSEKFNNSSKYHCNANLMQEITTLEERPEKLQNRRFKAKKSN